MWEGEGGGGGMEVGGGDFLTHLADAGQRVPFVVARGACVQSSEVRATGTQSPHRKDHTLQWGPRHLVFEFT